ncbi:hypothetical protein M899_3288 [Bacteriovorax sp. BSW11_IV]|uniref:hypothetical protein n=1 Tax=Bacteriovorax sp. BSW11_IV TaxID=1353529 RepID=UPI00038A2C15|nr:hypothetical protein [Bacteriovorax sp. BSW11_IV]EQC48248.1 hypothetical protein M899_3288 [Bacteriovorax sp. BSW11_IV]
MFKNLFKNNPELNKYYLRGLAPFALLVLVIELTPMDIMARFFIYIGYIWPYSIETPGLKERIQNPKYRFSFMRLVFNLDHFLGEFSLKLSPNHGEKIKMALAPFIYCSLMSFVASDVAPFYCLIGSLLYLALFEFLYKRLQK